MFKIVRTPAEIKPFFDALTQFFRWNHARYIQQFVLAIAIGWGRRNVSNIYRHIDAKTHRTRFNNFLYNERCDFPRMLRDAATLLLSTLSLKPGEPIFLVIDDTKKDKRGKEMDGVGYIYDPVSSRKTPGHLYVTAVVRAGGFTIPWGIRLYVKKEHAERLGVPFRKTTELAAELISSFESPLRGHPVRVLFDSFYLCAKVVRACRKRGFHFISTLKNNRNLLRGGRVLKAGTNKRSRFRRGRKRTATVGGSKGTKVFDYVDGGVFDLKGIGAVRVVYSRRRGEKAIAGLVTDCVHMSGGRIIGEYVRRWSIEVFFKDAKQLLGLGQYQNRSRRAHVTHLHLVLLACALLTHRLIQLAGAKAKRKGNGAKRSLGYAQNELRRVLWRDLVEIVEETTGEGESVFDILDRLLIRA